MRVLFCSIIFISYCFGHPHVFVDTKFDISIEKNTLQAYAYWYFDEMTSQVMLMDFDKNKNNKIDSNELLIIKKEAFEHLKELNYYTFIYQNKKNLSLSQPTDFSCFLTDKRIGFKFKVTTIFDPSKNNLKIGSFDMDNLTAFQMDRNSKINLQNKTLQNLNLQYVTEDYDYYVAEMLLLNWKGSK